MALLCIRWTKEPRNAASDICTVKRECWRGLLNISFSLNNFWFLRLWSYARNRLFIGNCLLIASVGHVLHVCFACIIVYMHLLRNYNGPCVILKRIIYCFFTLHFSSTFFSSYQMCYNLKFRCFDFQVSGRITELKMTIDIGLLHRDNILKNIAHQFEQWNHLVSSYINFFSFNLIDVDNQ